MKDGDVSDDVQGLPGCGDGGASSGNAWHLPEECVSVGQAEYQGNFIKYFKTVIFHKTPLQTKNSYIITDKSIKKY